jgi:hypothetical protein
MNLNRLPTEFFTSCERHDTGSRVLPDSDARGVSLASFVTSPQENSDFDIFVHESDDGEISALPYLDTLICTVEGGLESISESKTLRSIDMCGGSARYGSGFDSGKFYYLTNRCKLVYCPECSQEGGIIESVRLGRVYDRVDIENVNIRALFLTVPDEHREKVYNRSGINSLIKSSVKIAKDEFGKDSKIMVVPHLVGDKNEGPAPHINLLIFEDKAVKLKITLEQLDRIRDKWRQAVQGLVRVKIDVINIYYEFKIRLSQKKHLIRYIVRANFKYDEETLMMISSKEFYKFQWIRFRGGLKKHGEKDITDDDIKPGEIESQSQEKIKWLGIVSMKELYLRFGEIDVERVPGRFELFRETDKARKKRGTKSIKIY